jgi:hypothetical protein
MSLTPSRAARVAYLRKGYDGLVQSGLEADPKGDL